MYDEEVLSDMAYCPECGGEMQYISATKRNVCKSCGLSVSGQELMELRQQIRRKTPSDVEEHKKERKEYLKWWLGKKK